MKSSTRLRQFQAKTKRNTDFLLKVDTASLIDEIDFALNVLRSALWTKDSQDTKIRFEEALSKKVPYKPRNHNRSFYTSELIMTIHNLLFILRQELDKE